MNIVDTFLGLALFGSEWVLWLLLILSVVSVAVILERWLFFRKIYIDFAVFSERINGFLIENRMDAIRTLCENEPAPECQIVLKAIDFHAKGARGMEDRMNSFLISQRQFLDRGLVILGTLGSNAPFIGLFGTVIGIIVAFNDLAADMNDPSVVMAGVSEALVATAVGLLVAIPAVIAYNVFQRVVRRHLSNAESIVRLLCSHFAQNESL